MKDVKLLYFELRNMSDFGAGSFCSQLIASQIYNFSSFLLWIFIYTIFIEKSELRQRSATLYYL